MGGGMGATGDEQTPFNVVFVLGPPGCGKGTQCKRIAQTFNWVHLSAGDLLRAERARPGSQLGEMIEMHIQNGTIVPVEVTCRLLENAMHEHAPAPGFLVDGFPRNLDNREGWEREMQGKANLQFVLFIECPQEVCLARCLARGQGRTDDNEQSLKLRIETYLSHTRPIIEHYEKLQLVRSIDGSRSPDQIFEDVRKVFT